MATVRWHSFVSLLAFLLISGTTDGADWPMWRFDANRSAASPHELPADLQLHWTREYSAREQVWDDPLNHDLMQYDRAFEPVVSDGRMFVGFNDSGKVVAISVEDGTELWRFYSGGPVRMPPVVAGGLVYFTSDDGYLYCVGCEDGKLRWRFRGGPSEQKVLGNKRVISAWPARGGPVVRDGVVYFAASIWPFMGTFIYALEATTGEVQWVNDGTGAQFIKQPHSANAFGGVGPQGAMVATKDLLLVPGGRSVPAAFDRQTGEFKYFHINAGGKGIGGAFVVANEQDFFVHTRIRGVRAFDLATGSKTSRTFNEPVLTGERIYSAAERESVKSVGEFDLGGKSIREFKVDASGDLIRAGSRLYAAGGGKISSVPLRSGNNDSTWSVPVKGEVVRLLAANSRLFAVTLEGDILCFGEGKRQPGGQDETTTKALPKSIAKPDVLNHTDGLVGRALAIEVGSSETLAGLLTHSKFRIDAVHSSSTVVEELRRGFDRRNGDYGSRVAVHEGDVRGFKAPPYFARLVHVGAAAAETFKDEVVMTAAYRSVRPYGGVLWIECEPADAEKIVTTAHRADLAKAEITTQAGGVLIRKQGALEGAADWTHLYGNVANTVKSDDTLVKAPLGLLWFGGNSNMDVLPRHGHGPSEQVIGGRLFIEGMDSISARDVYTGEILWKRTFPDLGTFGVYYNETYKDTPLSPAYNQRHIPGANGRGPNYIATEDTVYLAVSNVCVALDARTGGTSRIIELPRETGSSELRQWGYIGVYEDLLLAGNGFAHFTKQYANASGRKNDAIQAAKKGATKKPSYAPIEDLSASKGLTVFDRRTGKVLWNIAARHSFLHNGIVAGNGRIYCLDRLPKSAEDKRKRRGMAAPADYRIVALDARTGRELWEDEQGITGSWLGYSADRDILLQAGAKASDRLRDEVGQGMTAYVGASGKVRWLKPSLNYTGPCILHNDLVMSGANSYKTSAGAFSLLDGSPHLIENPLTGAMEPWKLSRTYGCNTIVASEHLLTFRSGAAGYYDLTGHSGTGNLGGFKSGCTSNLIIANGVLNAPDYTRTCSCSYQNQTSLALIHMPEMEMWTYSQIGAEAEAGAQLQRVGINFGAPGDRRSEDGILWLDHPSVGGQSPGVEVALEGEGVDYFRRHSAMVSGAGLPWVNASGVSGATRITIVPRTADAASQSASGAFVFPARDAADTAEETGKGKVTTSSSDLELVRDRAAQVVGLRFPKIKLPRNADIESAHIQFTVDETSKEATRLNLAIQDIANAPAFGNKAKNVSNRATLAKTVEWKPSPWTKIGAVTRDQRTPDLAPLLRRVIGRKDWKSGNAIAFKISGSGKRVAKSRGKDAPRLVVTLKDAPDAKIPAEQTATVPYHVRLHFAEPGNVAPGERVFSVKLQGRTVLSGLDIRQETGASGRGLVREFRNIPVAEKLQIELSKDTPGSAGPILSGVELVAARETQR